MSPVARTFAISFCVIAAIGALFGASIGAILVQPPHLGAALGALSGLVDFAAMMALIGGAEYFLPRTRFGKALARMPFLAVFGVKVVAYSSVILAVTGSRLGTVAATWLVEVEQARQLRQQVQENLPLGLLIPTGFLVTFILLLLHQLGLLVGAKTVRDIMLGRYHRARLEERFFLFVDIVGSTPLAEKLGPAAANRFLGRVFELASDPVDENHGEIYQYVGDEMVVTWQLADGRPQARPLACYYAIEKAILENEAEFQRDFGAVPRLRAALHAGQVITGEVGGSRRAIVFHGDVMNATSRIESATRELKRPFLASEDALARLEGKQAYALSDLGPQPLRGREGRVRLYAVGRS